MKKIIILGNTNVGKTLFMLNFAKYVGIEKVLIKFKYPDGKILNKEMSIDIAKKTLSSNVPHKTRCLQLVDIKIPIYKGYKDIQLIDTCGLIDGIHPDICIRDGIVQTLEQIDISHIIIHLVDISLDCYKILSYIDKQLINYGKNRGNYVLLANKIDLDTDRKGITYLMENLKDVYIIPISALYMKGFDEVKSFVINS